MRFPLPSFLTAKTDGAFFRVIFVAVLLFLAKDLLELMRERIAFNAIAGGASVVLHHAPLLHKTPVILRGSLIYVARTVRERNLKRKPK